jgi:DNA-binding PadR family transcriptional regulator
MDVRTQCLGLLLRGPATGYEIKKLVEDGPFCHFLEASFASIYPALTRLTAENLLTVVSTPQTNRPDKKVYKITESGRAAFINSLLKPLGADKFRSPWLTAMYFADYLPQDKVLALITERAISCEAQLALIEDALSDAASDGERFVAGMGRHLIEAELEYLKSQAPRMIVVRSDATLRKRTDSNDAAVHELS